MINPGKKIGIGIVGLGNIAPTHAEAILATDRAELITGCSRSEANRNSFVQQFDLPAYSDYDTFLTHKGVDAVTICTPSGTHLDYGKKAAEAGKHLIIEKPIEISVKRGRELIDCCSQNGVQLAVIYQNRFIEGAKQMKRAIDSGHIGDPIMIRASVKWFRDQEYYKGSGWRGTLELDGGGAVINQSIHTIDLLVWIMGDISSLSAYKGTFTHPGIEAEDSAVSVLEFKSGALGVFEASTSVVPAQSRSIEINGTKGTARLDGDQFSIVQNGLEKGTGEEKKSRKGGDSPLSGMSGEDHGNQYQIIVDAIIENRVPDVSGEESLRSLAVVEAIYNSSEQQKRVFPGTILKN